PPTPPNSSTLPLHDALPISAFLHHGTDLSPGVLLGTVYAHQPRPEDAAHHPQVSQLHAVVAAGQAPQAIQPAAGTGRLAPQIARDRKSTRLNSSHVKISYAV